MNRYELICQYCNHSWQINYLPQDIIYCGNCRDSKIDIRDLAKEFIDTYAGSPPFPKKELEIEKDDPDKWYI